jgi:tRNA G18 (ribose-2'-O)-methylase SpoU
MKIIHIQDITDERISNYLSLKESQNHHTQEQIFLCDGDKVTLVVLESQVQIQSVFAVEDFINQNKTLLETKVPEGQVFTASKKLMESIVGFRLHSGVMAIATQPSHRHFTSLKPPYIVMNNIINSDNVGGIIRNAIGCGFTSILADNATSSPYLRRAVRVSMGYISKAHISIQQNLLDTLITLKNQGCSIICAEISERSHHLQDYTFPKNFALVFGSEGQGIESDILSIADEILDIPMHNNVKSLNVSSSSAIFMYAAKHGK